jgi:hypothetical protein
VRLVALASVLVAATAAAAGDPVLPPRLLAAVAALDAAAAAVERRDIDRQSCRPRPAHPARVAADFTGDGRLDYALYVRSAPARPGDRADTEHTVRFVIFVAAAGGFTPHVIREWPSTLPLHSRLEIQRPGRIREVDGGEGQMVRLRHPGVVEVYCGQAASTFFWEPRTRTFRSVVTGD